VNVSSRSLIKRRCSEETVQSWSPWSQSWGWKGVYGARATLALRFAATEATSLDGYDTFVENGSANFSQKCIHRVKWRHIYVVGSQCDRHFVGQHVVLCVVKWWRFDVLFESNWISRFKKMFVLSLFHWESDVYWRQNNKHLAELAPQNGRKQLIWRNCLTVTLCIIHPCLPHRLLQVTGITLLILFIHHVTSA